jgi:hypothetical protein
MLGNFCFVLGSASVMPLIETNPPRRVGPPRPPARIDTVLLMLMLMSMLRLPGVIDIRALHSTWRCDVRLMVMLCFEPSQRQVGCKRTIT